MERKYKMLIVVTTYNQLATTRKVMEHLQELDHDILVIDDGSTDGTPEYLAQIKVEAHCKGEHKGRVDSWEWAYQYFKCAKEYTNIVLVSPGECLI